MQAIQNSRLDAGLLPEEQAETLLALIHARSEVERLGERERLFSNLLDNLNVVLWALDWKGQRMIYISPAYERIFGRSVALLLANYSEWRNCIYPDDLEYAQRSLLAVLERGAVENREYRIIRGDGQLRWISDKCFIARSAGLELEPGSIIVGIVEDITDRKQHESELQRLAHIDEFTQGGNRWHFLERAQREFDHARQYATPLAFLLLDVDDLKRISDAFGHAVCDEVLRMVAQCCRSVLRRGDHFGRIGHEEFALMLPGCSPELAAQIAMRLQVEIQRLPLRIREQSCEVTISLGLAALCADDSCLSSLIARADSAMQQARQAGNNRIITT
ncbi:sensor domain-containing diguanylate cyclase [Azomonas macrocytogenes]|uniref:Diguanylate cyclase (GGDEF)-like protein/PAS domain S-box-containing protein n=1 Tax=Azomonas macrocytogenes TaxID=69962 RepID=A0A839T326_AZOMA|nr:sensor domain-containing diguanylate cyclase [Azomonas macrocytogenes]MBB3103508.1 diguanylate cyclase (GGDEF)-like protein/PAS domain S-box-containing protein [Azomonas macrocytogenes]